MRKAVWKEERGARALPRLPLGEIRMRSEEVRVVNGCSSSTVHAQLRRGMQGVDMTRSDRPTVAPCSVRLAASTAPSVVGSRRGAIGPDEHWPRHQYYLSASAVSRWDSPFHKTRRISPRQLSSFVTRHALQVVGMRETTRAACLPTTITLSHERRPQLRKMTASPARVSEPVRERETFK